MMTLPPAIRFFAHRTAALALLALLLLPRWGEATEGETELDARIDINTAGEAELQQLPMIGPALSAAIVRDREQNGLFPHPAALERVARIGPATMQRLCPLIRAGEVIGCDAELPDPEGATAELEACVNINLADATQLEELNGIGPGRAQAILRSRAQEGDFMSVEDLARVSGIGEGIVSMVRSRVCVTFDVNSIDRESLRRVPVLSLDVADRIIDNRDEHGPYMTLQSLLRVYGVRVEDVRELTRYLHVRN